MACPGPRPGSRWPADARPARGTRTSAARLRTGWEEESPRTGDSNPGCNCLVRGYSPSMHFFWGGDMPRYSPPLPFRRGRAGARACGPARGAPGSGVAVLLAVWRAQARAPGRAGRRARAWDADVRGTVEDGRGGGIPRTGDSNPGCNCLVRGYSPSMHFFWGGDMPRYSPPLPFRRGRAGCPCVLPSPRGRPARWLWTCALAGVPRPAPSHPLGCDSPAFLASLCSPFSFSVS